MRYTSKVKKGKDSSKVQKGRISLPTGGGKGCCSESGYDEGGGGEGGGGESRLTQTLWLYVTAKV